MFFIKIFTYKQIMTSDLSLDKESETKQFDFSRHFSTEEHDALIDFLKSYNEEKKHEEKKHEKKHKDELKDTIYLVPNEYFTTSKKDDRETYEFKYEFGSKEAREFTLPFRLTLISGLVRRAVSLDKEVKS